MKASLLLCNGWSSVHLTLYCFSFLLLKLSTSLCPFFALLALVAYSVSLALIVPGLLQKNGGWRRMAIISAVIALVCHAIALEARILPDGDSGQNLSLLNVGSLVSLMILYGNDHCGFSQSWLVAATHCLCLCAYQPGAGDLHAQ
ncbi:putative magnesium transport protein [Escherichia coli]|uniref:Putative magnesium transport protein n=1 Tax=Escherichia coli TaxID=562 RepID=A0A376KSL2_ECOLX|nr:putative magnesium transport protein [Escherichia coli]